MKRNLDFLLPVNPGKSMPFDLMWWSFQEDKLLGEPMEKRQLIEYVFAYVYIADFLYSKHVATVSDLIL